MKESDIQTFENHEPAKDGTPARHVFGARVQYTAVLPVSEWEYERNQKAVAGHALNVAREHLKIALFGHIRQDARAAWVKVHHWLARIPEVGYEELQEIERLFEPLLNAGPKKA